MTICLRCELRPVERKGVCALCSNAASRLAEYWRTVDMPISQNGRLRVHIRSHASHLMLSKRAA